MPQNSKIDCWMSFPAIGLAQGLISDWPRATSNQIQELKSYFQSPVRDRQSKQRNYLGKTSIIPPTEHSGSPAPPQKSGQNILDSDEEKMSHETHLSRMSQESF